MKILVHIALFLFSIILLNSCASNNHLELVGHYKPNTDVAKAKNSSAEKSAEQFAALPEKSSDVAINSDESAPDLKLLNITIQNSEQTISLTDHKQQKLEKKLQKVIQKVEQRAGHESKTLQTGTSSSEKKITSHSADDSQVLLAILAILLPPLAVYLFEDSITTHFWISVLLTILFWIPGVIYALIIIFGG